MAENIEVGNLNVKVSLDDSGINKSMAELNRAMRVVQSEFQAASAKLGDFGKSADGLRLRADSLTKQIEIQRQRVAKLAEEHAKAAAEKGEDAKETQNLEVRLNKAQAELAKMEGELKQVTGELEKHSSGWYETGQALELVESELELATAKLGDAAKGTEGLRVHADALTKQIEIQRQRVAILAQEHAKAAEEKGKDAAETKDLQIELNRAQAELARLENELKQVNSEITKQSNSWYQFGQRLEKASEKLQRIGDRMQEVGRSLAMTVTAPLAAIGGLSTKAAIDFETAFAGVRKTVDATEAEFAELEKGIRDMAKEIPASAVEIAKVAEAAGQLGIQKNAIMGFTRTMVDLGVATNMTSDQAATALARLANITQMNQQNFDRLGASIVALGNNLATTESEIVEMGLRIAGAGAQIGLTEAQILGFAAALSSVGIEAEAGGTAISRVFITISNAVQEGSQELGLFAQVAGMSVAEFSRLFREDAAMATVAFIEGLDRLAKSGGNVFAVLEELGLSEIRVRDALLRAAGAGDLFRNSIELASRAWEENTALTKEAEERYKTTASQLQILKNRIVDVGITLGQALIPALLKALDALNPLINLLATMAQWFANLPPGIQTTIISLAALFAAIAPLLMVGGALASSFASIGAALGKLTTFFGSAGGAAAVFGRAIAALTGPIGIAIAAISTLLAAVTAVYRFFRADSIPAVQGFGDAAQKASERAVGSFKKVQNELRNTTEVARVEAPKIGDNLAKGIGGGARRGADEAAKAMRDAVDRMKQEVDRNRDALNRLGEALVEALKKQYQEMEEAQLKALDRQLENERRASEERIKIYDKEYAERLKLIDEEAYRQIKALQDQIDAIDAQTKAEEKALEEQEYRQRVAELRKRLEAAETAEERERIERELNKVIADYERRRLLEQRNAQKEALREQIQAIREAADAQKEQLRAELEARKAAEQERLKAIEEALEAEKQSVRDHFAELTKQENLMAEARKLVIKKNNDEIIRLLSTYVPKWQDTGQSFADAFIYGLNSEKQSIEEAVREIVAIAPVIDDQMKQLEQMQARLEAMTGRTAGGGGGGGVAGGFGGIAASIGDITANANELADTLMGQLVPAVEQVGESAQQMSDDAVEAFIGLRHRASVELNQLYWSGQQVSEQTASSIADTFAAMGQIIVDNLDAAHAQQLQSMQQFLANATTMTQEEKDKLLQSLQEAQAKEAEIVEQGQRRVAEILARALEEQRGLTKAEYDEINRIMADMTATAERTLSDYEAKQKALFEKMRIDASQLTALQAAEVVRNSKQQRDEAIKAAEEQYTNVVAEIIRQRDELGIITKEQADKLIAEAKRQRDEAVRHAEEMHKRVVEQAKKQAEEHVKLIDWETGEVKSRWRVLVDDMKQIGKDVIGGFIQGLKEKYKELRDYWRDIVESMPQQLKNLLRISSPSKVMMELGEWTGEGFAVGLQRSMASIMRQAEAIAEVATAASSRPAVAAASAGPSQAPVINIYMEGLLAGANFGPAYTDTDREQLAREIARNVWHLAMQEARGQGGVWR